MSEEEKALDWCIVRWHNGQILFYRESQWWPQGKHFPEKWEYVAKGLTFEQAKNYKELFKE
jgi:hypothetical protein